MSENEIRQCLQKIKVINKKFVAYYYSETLGSDNGLSGFGDINGKYVISIKDAIGGYINNVKSKRILKAIGFEHYDENKYLIPVNGIGLIEDGTKIISILGEEVIVGESEINTDSRNGMLPYYIELEGLKN